jgi:hypothetical protein
VKSGGLATLVLNRSSQISMKIVLCCRADSFRYRTKFLALKDEFWLRYEYIIKNTKNRLFSP